MTSPLKVQFCCKESRHLNIRDFTDILRKSFVKTIISSSCYQKRIAIYRKHWVINGVLEIVAWSTIHTLRIHHSISVLIISGKSEESPVVVFGHVLNHIVVKFSLLGLRIYLTYEGETKVESGEVDIELVVDRENVLKKNRIEISEITVRVERDLCCFKGLVSVEIFSGKGAGLAIVKGTSQELGLSKDLGETHEIRYRGCLLGRLYPAPYGELLSRDEVAAEIEAFYSLRDFFGEGVASFELVVD